MLKTIRGIILGAAAACALLSFTALGKNASEFIDVIYNNIKIVIDGQEFIPTDENGKTIEPFTYNGTTYLPVRAIAQAFNKDVEWDGATSTISINSRSEESQPEEHPEITDTDKELLTSDKLVGKWKYDAEPELLKIGASYLLLSEYDVYMTYEFYENGVMLVYIDNESFADYVDVCFRLKKGMDLQEYAESVNKAPDKVLSEIFGTITTHSFESEGAYELRDGKLYINGEECFYDYNEQAKDLVIELENSFVLLKKIV